MVLKIIFLSVLVNGLFFSAFSQWVGEWSGALGEGEKVQYFHLTITKQKKNFFQGELYDSFLQDRSSCLSKIKGYFLTKSKTKVLIKGEKQLFVNNTSLKNKHELSIIFLTKNSNASNVLLAKVAALNDFASLMDTTFKQNEFIFEKIAWKDFLTKEYKKKKATILQKEPKPKQKILALDAQDSIEKFSYKLYLKDYDNEDFDIVSLKVNGQLLVNKHIISKTEHPFDVKMTKKRNIIEVVAIDEGRIPPVTLKIEFLKNGKIEYSMPVNLKKGESHTHIFENPDGLDE